MIKILHLDPLTPLRTTALMSGKPSLDRQARNNLPHPAYLNTLCRHLDVLILREMMELVAANRIIANTYQDYSNSSTSSGIYDQVLRPS